MMMFAVDPITNPVITGFAKQKPEDTPAIFAKFFSALIGALLIGASLWTFIQLLWGGMDWISSGGDKSKLEMAQHRITTALLGLFVVVSSWALYLIVLQFLGISPVGSSNFEFKIPTLF